MSVLECDRGNCTSIMCDKLILGKYICDDCWQELLNAKKKWPTTMKKAEVRGFMEDFMKSQVGDYNDLDIIDIEKEFRRLTECRY